MGMTDEGLNHVRDLIYDDITHGQLGTDGTAFSSNDTDLGTADATTALALTAKSKGDKIIKLEYKLPSTGGTTTTYKEFKLYNDTGSKDYTRDVMTGISFVSSGTEDIIITTRMFVRSSD